MTTIYYKGMEVGKLPDLQNYVLKENVGDLAYMDTVPDSMIAASSSVSLINQAIDDIWDAIEGGTGTQYSLDWIEADRSLELAGGEEVQKLELTGIAMKSDIVSGSIADQFVLGDVLAILGVKQTISLYNTQADTYQDYPYLHYDATIIDDAAADITHILAVDSFDAGTGLPYLTREKPTLDLQIGTYADVPSTFAQDISGDEDVTTNEYLPEYYEVADATVILRFSDGSALSSPSFHILRFKGAGRKLYGLKSVANAYIDTGLPMDGTCIFEVTGYFAGGGTAALMGAFVDTGNRTTLRMLPTSNKFQAMWSANQEITGHGIDIAQEFTYRQKANEVVFTQGGHTYTHTGTGHVTTQSGGANILLMQEAAGGSYGSVVLCDAMHRNQFGQLLHHYEPFSVPDGNGGMVNVFVDTHNLLPQEKNDIRMNGLTSSYAAGRVYQAVVGSLEEVTA